MLTTAAATASDSAVFVTEVKSFYFLSLLLVLLLVVLSSSLKSFYFLSLLLVLLLVVLSSSLKSFYFISLLLVLLILLLLLVELFSSLFLVGVAAAAASGIAVFVTGQIVLLS